MAVLLLAAADVIDRSTSPLAARRRHFAAVWFKSDWRGVGSFLWIADTLGLEPSWIRRTLLTRQNQRGRRQRLRA
jgi:hypothetical protein